MPALDDLVGIRARHVGDEAHAALQATALIVGPIEVPRLGQRMVPVGICVFVAVLAAAVVRIRIQLGRLPVAVQVSTGIPVRRIPRVSVRVLQLVNARLDVLFVVHAVRVAVLAVRVRLKAVDLVEIRDLVAIIVLPVVGLQPGNRRLDGIREEPVDLGQLPI